MSVNILESFKAYQFSSIYLESQMIEMNDVEIALEAVIQGGFESVESTWPDHSQLDHGDLVLRLFLQT